MNSKLFFSFVVMVLLGLFLIGCSGNDIIEPLPPDEVEAEVPVVTEARFTIKADDDLLPAITALYAAFFQGESPQFVDGNADLIATSSEPQTGERPMVKATFLPGSVLFPVSDSNDVLSFIQFAISTEGQKVLIDIGELPAMVTITDLAGNNLEITQPVNRVISAYGPSTAIVYALNAGERLMAASFLGARDPQGAAAMARIDPRFLDLMGDDNFSQQDFDFEFAAGLEPDLVIGGARSQWADSVKQLGIEVFLMEAETPDQLKQAVLLIGQLFGPHSYAQAQAWVDYYELIVDQVLAQTADIPPTDRPQVLFTGTEPLRVASGDMYQTDIIESAGGVSVSAQLSGFWNDINLEQVAIWNPDIIIVPPYGGASVEAITESSEWQILLAVQEGQVYRMPKLVVPWDTPAPDSVLGIIWMAELINQDLVDLTCEQETEYFYNTFYNYAISGEEIAALCIVE